MTDEYKGYSPVEGWYFRREENGSVRVIAPDSFGKWAYQVAKFDPDAWAAILLSVSQGEDQTPPYVHALLDAFLAGSVLDFGRHAVPLDVQQRLQKAVEQGGLGTVPVKEKLP